MKKLLLLIAMSMNISMFAMEKPELSNQERQELNEQLILAIDTNDIKRVEELLDKGVSPDADHALANAAVAGNLEICKLLVKRGANTQDFNILASIGLTPLMIAAEKGQVELVKFMLENGADRNRSDRSGNTALMLAAFRGQANTVFTLLTTIPLHEKEKIVKERYAFNATISMRQLPKDIQRKIRRDLLNKLIQEQMDQVKELIAHKNTHPQSAQAMALSGNHPAIARMLDLNNPISYRAIEKEIEKNIRLILFPPK